MLQSKGIQDTTKNYTKIHIHTQRLQDKAYLTPLHTFAPLQTKAPYSYKKHAYLTFA